MDNYGSSKLESELFSELKSETHASKKRKMVEKRVVMVRVGENFSKVKNEGLPCDSWSWRKYGQKPIKGSPYPRGYYRCSTCKGCSAKKQVEKCRTDSSMLIITYTSNHNHSAPNSTQQSKESKTMEKEDPFKLNTEKRHGRIDLVIEEKPFCSAKLKNFSALKSEKLDFFDELEELPMFSSFLHFTKTNFLDEIIHIAPNS